MLLCFALLSINWLQAQCSGLQIIGFNSDTPDQILLEATADIPAGTMFYITDNEWDDTNQSFTSGETTVIWTAPATGVAAGSTILLEGSTATCGTLNTDINGLSASGEELYVLNIPPSTTAGSVTASDICFGILFGGTGSINGITGVDLGDIDNATYNGSGAITSASNWTTDNTFITLPTAVCTSLPVQAIGTCAGITSANENNYNIIITNLDPAVTYNIDLNGDGTADVTGITGVGSYTTTTPIAFTNGTAAQTVQVDAGGDGSYETMVVVHEVLCTDADDDGDIDFDSGCDVSTMMADQGYIVSTVAPYNGNNVYVYVLTNPTNNALAANTSGLFTGLASGGNGATNDYNVVAFNFATVADANAFIAGLTFGASGTVVTTATSPMGCSASCGTMAYNIECCNTPVATVNDPTICEGTTSTDLTITVTAGNPVTYSIDFADATITDVTSTTIPSSNIITVTLPSSLAAGSYMGTITFEEYPGCSGTDDFTITIDPSVAVEAGTGASICSTGSIDLTTLGASITGGSTSGTWSTTTGGTFDGSGVFGTATTYTPSAADVAAGSVTLTLTSDDPTGPCPAVSDTVTIPISNVTCGTFPWNGN